MWLVLSSSRKTLEESVPWSSSWSWLICQVDLLTDSSWIRALDRTRRTQDGAMVVEMSRDFLPMRFQVSSSKPRMSKEVSHSFMFAT
jgi:hypothetical protein